MVERSVEENKMSGVKKVKILFTVDRDDERGVKTESLWAEPMGLGQFRILNSPFFLFGISADDVVKAEQATDGLRFRALVSRGGHSTYRIYLQDGRTIEHPDFLENWRPISKLGATFENADGHFVVVDIPPGKEVSAIYDLMTKGEQDGVWAFEEVLFARENAT